MVHNLIKLIGWLYTIDAFILGIFSANMLMLTTLFWVLEIRRKAAKKKEKVRTEIPSWPVVTVQLPVYNEQLVAGRLIDAVAQLDYPANALQIQVLDDSTDDTVALVDERVAYWESQGKWIEAVRREKRVDYKAGALKSALGSAVGDFIAIFDADFIPPKDWLRKALPPFFQPGNEKIGLVQTRWSHLNEEYSLLTRAQALALDGHFGIEQNVRARAGFFLNFNGTAGIWRRECIQDAGNWRGATMAEDLDLSYRAQLRGWKVHYLIDITAPAELPTLMIGFKRQQFRWSKGSIQVARLLGPTIIHADINPVRKVQGIIHVLGYMTHPLLIMMLLFTLPLTLWGENILHRLPVGWLGMVGLGLPLFYATSQIAIYKKGSNFWRWLTRMPLLMMLGVGIAVNNSRAILEGFSKKPGVFERTPKTGATRRQRGANKVVTERFKVDASLWFELSLGVYAIITSLLVMQQGNWIGAAIYAIYAIGFTWVGTATLMEALRSAQA